MVEHVTETIWISREAYMYLDRESRKQRGCKELSPEGEERLWRRLSRYNVKDGKIRVDDNSLCGGDGTYDGMWWSWKVSTLKKMLDEAGFTYKDGDKIRYINL